MTTAAKKKTSPAAIFLIAITVIILLVLAVFVWMRLNPLTMLQIAFVPEHAFDTEAQEERLDYAEDASWFALPGSPGQTVSIPKGSEALPPVENVDVFFVHSTSFFERSSWLAPLAHEAANRRTREIYMKNKASAFADAGNIYAPRYRQGAFGAFFDESGDGVKALWVANGDVVAAFDAFLKRRSDPDRGILLAGHSQGALHLIHLLHQRFDGTALTDKLVAAYILGWPISVEADIDAVKGVEPCETARDTGCVVSFQIFGEGGDPKLLIDGFHKTPGVKGASKVGTEMLCTDPISFTRSGSSDKASHMGAVKLSDYDVPLPALEPTFTGTYCKDGIVFMTDTPQTESWREHLMAGENFHAYDLNLFYMNLRQNARQRALVWQQSNTAPMRAQ